MTRVRFYQAGCPTSRALFARDVDPVRIFGITQAELLHGVYDRGNDLLIAAHEGGLGLALVTNNTREFGKVTALKVENWSIRG
jgi:tRNA(fMet)-specific endonuclease VapC